MSTGDSRGPRFDGWSDLIHALPAPAVVTDGGGNAIIANDWLDFEAGAPVFLPDSQTANGAHHSANGRSRWSVRPLDADGAYFLAMHDLDGARDHLLRRMVSTSGFLFVVYDEAGRIIESNDAWKTILGYQADELVGLESWALVPDEDLVARAAVEKELREAGRSQPTWRMRHADGSTRVVEWTLVFDQTLRRCFGIGRDATGNEERSEELHRRVFADPLTGLANRRRLTAELERHLTLGRSPVVLFLDLDHFKVVNDALGHIVGDELLALVGRRLEKAVDDREVLVARFGGDEFVVVLPDADSGRAQEMAERLVNSMNEPIDIRNQRLHLGVSVGVALTPEGTAGSAVEVLLQHADLAVYEAKHRGRNRWAVFDEGMQHRVDRRHAVETGLRTAIEMGDIVAEFQPIVNLDTRRTVGFEALARWRRGGGLVTASEFIDVADDCGLLPSIGREVVEAATLFAAELHRHSPDVWVSVNASASELVDPGFFGHFVSHAETNGVDPTRLMVEVTESAVLGLDKAPSALGAFRSAGMRIALDDFGTGFSSLAHLRSLPIDVVKIDRTFVTDLVDDATTQAVTAAVLDLCGALGHEIVLEGIEREVDVRAARNLGGQLGQGFLFGPGVMTAPSGPLDPHGGAPRSR